MRRIHGIEWFVLLLALVFIVAGADFVLEPTDLTVLHPGLSDYHLGWLNPFQHLSANAARAYGVVTILFGGGLLWIVFTKKNQG